MELWVISNSTHFPLLCLYKGTIDSFQKDCKVGREGGGEVKGRRGWGEKGSWS